MRNVISVGFYKQTDDAEYILKVDEHRITGGEEDVVEYRWVQNLVMQKSFEQYTDGFTAFDQHILFKNNKRCCTELMASDTQLERSAIRLRRNNGSVITQQNRLHNKEESTNASWS